MIPKIIHYCWFGGNPKSKLIEKCIKSWGGCAEYKIIEWNESNYDISSAPLYVRQAYEHQRWAFVSDYVRLDVVFRFGGIYLDTDVELLKKLDSLLKYDAFFGFENELEVNTGIGFGAVKGCRILLEMMNEYNEIPYIKNGVRDAETCPTKNTRVLLNHNLKLNTNEVQILENNIYILPKEYLCPLEFWTRELKCTENTISIHWFDASWYDEIERKRDNKIKRRERILHTPNRILMKLLGDKKYNRLKYLIKKGKEINDK